MGLLFNWRKNAGRGAREGGGEFSSGPEVKKILQKRKKEKECALSRGDDRGNRGRAGGQGRTANKLLLTATSR